MTTLTVDDMPASVTMMTKMLYALFPDGRHFGAKNADEALRLITEDTGAAFLDVEMPGMNGFELAKLLKKRNAHLHIIIMSGSSEYERRAQESSYSFLQKPVFEEDILSALKSFDNKAQEPE